MVVRGHGTEVELSLLPETGRGWLALRTLEQQSDIYIAELEAGGQQLCVLRQG